MQVKTILLIVAVFMSSFIQSAYSRGPQDHDEYMATRAATLACVRFMTDNREGETVSAEAACSDPWMVEAFTGDTSAQAFNRCWGFFAARRVGHRATPYELQHAPSVLCRGNNLTTALLDGFRATNYHIFADCLDEIGSFFDADVARCTKSLEYTYDTNQRKRPASGNNSKGVRSAE